MQGELLQFEQQKQAELQAEIQQLQDELERSGDRDDDLSGMLTAFGVRHLHATRTQYCIMRNIPQCVRWWRAHVYRTSQLLMTNAKSKTVARTPSTPRYGLHRVPVSVPCYDTFSVCALPTARGCVGCS